MGSCGDAEGVLGLEFACIACHSAGEGLYDDIKHSGKEINLSTFNRNSGG